MTEQISRPFPTGRGGDYFVYSPASSYPVPYATLIDRTGAEVHTWSHTAAQHPVSDDPPSFLRGWSHVEVDADGCLFAMVPLRALIKLAPDSTLLWQADIPAHHDLALLPGGGVLTLAGAPRRIVLDGLAATVLDNTIAELDATGCLLREVSLFDVLATEHAVVSLLRQQISLRQAVFARTGEMPTGEAGDVFSTGSFSGPVTRAIAHLRQLPGSPCDVLHANTLEVLAEHPAGLWPDGALLVSMRDLDLIAVVDLNAPRVLWWWGPGEVSGQHQPSILPNGNLLVLDNGSTVGRSRVLEVDPVTRTIVWQYGTRPGEQFFTEVAGGCERLPSGNILISDALAGRAFEVTSTRHTVWRWQTGKEADSVGTSRATFYRLSRVPDQAAAALLQGRPAPVPPPGRGLVLPT
ncbi:aryl-sulfate sulfotransferase [Streptomyces sp. NPDC056169]|uniref:aryl-sulfate sulfotransferase n=1 Tax=Streptomyces sp. NPDC056169 TaxID=3345734 RepID=UPI0035E333E7